MSDAFLASEYPPASPERAGFHVIPVPLERSVSYGGGTGKGPAAILAASQQLEGLENGMAPGESGIYTAPAVDVSGHPEAVLGRVEAAVDKELAAGASAASIPSPSGRCARWPAPPTSAARPSEWSSSTPTPTCATNTRATRIPTPASCAEPWPTWGYRSCSSPCAR